MNERIAVDSFCLMHGNMPTIQTLIPKLGELLFRLFKAHTIEYIVWHWMEIYYWETF